MRPELPAGDSVSGATISLATAALWVAGASAVALITAWAVFRARDTPPPARERPLRFAIEDPTLAPNFSNAPRIAISPAGDRVFWIVVRDGKRQVATRSLASLETQLVGGSEGTRSLAGVAADGESVAIVGEQGLAWLALRGGVPSRVATIGVFRGAAFAEDGAIWYCPMTEAGVFRVAATGGERESIVMPQAGAGERSFRWPALLPGGEVVLYTVATAKLESFAEARIEAYSTRTRARKVVVERASYPIFLPPDRLFFVRSGGLFEARLDVERLAVVGEPRLVQDGVGDDQTSGLAEAALARDGTLVYLAGSGGRLARRLVEVARDGGTRQISEPAPYQRLGASPDGKTLVMDIDAAGAQIWLVERDRGTRVRLTDSWSNNFPIWRRDGRAVIYNSGRGDRFHVFELGIDGGAPRTLLESETASLTQDVSPDGRRLLVAHRSAGQFDLAELRLDGPASSPPALEPLVATPFNEDDADYSPDGRWLAFVSDETGSAEVYLLPLPGPGRKLRVTTEGGRLPLWSPDGTEIVFRAGADELHAARVSLGAEPSVARPRRFAQLDAAIYDMAMLPDGKVAVVLEPARSQAPAAPLVVARGWNAAPVRDER